MQLTIFGHWGGYPAKNEGTSSYLLEEDGFKLLIDVGASAVSIMENVVDPNELDAVIISHYHPDHVADVGILQHVRLLSNQTNRPPILPIYAHKEDERGYSYLDMPDISEAHEYKGSDTLTIGPFTITFLKTVHPVPCYAMRFEAGGKAFVYTADSAFFKELIPFAKDADLLAADTNFFKDMAGKSKVHMASIEVGEIAEKAQVKELLLTHLPQSDHLAELKEEASTVYSGRITIASKNLRKTI